MAEQLVEVIILRDFWDEDGKRHPRGLKVKVPAEAAMDGVESGSLSRVKTKKA